MSDAKKIANHIEGFTVDEIEDIRQHMFFREHRRDGRIARFDASYEQAEAWQRLVSGKNIRESDRVMLLHEQMESVLELDIEYSIQRVYSKIKP